MRIFLIKNEKIENLVECESLESAQSLFPDFLCIEAISNGEPGDMYQNGSLIKIEKNYE